MNRLTFTTLLINFALGLKLENVTVPKYGSLHGWVKLYCDFVMDADEPLLVLKWYKDGHEFFRYSPNIQPNILDFPTAGVHVNVSQSGLNHVMLRNISLQSGGSYKCEVSADRPSFRTLQGTGDMIVIAPPAADPEITGIHPAVSVGETINANCTSFHSQPAASLMFYINEEKAEAGEIREFVPISEPNGLETSILGLHFLVEPRHFKHGSLELKCTATIGNSYRLKRINISEAKFPNAQPSIPNNRPLLSGATPIKFYSSCTLKTTLLTLAITTLFRYSH